LNKLFKKSRQWLSFTLTAMMLLAFILPANVSASTEPVSLAKWDFSSTTDKLKATSGTTANLDKTLSTTGGPTIASSYVTGPSGSTGPTVPNASPWITSSTVTVTDPAWNVAISTKGYENITLSSMQYGSSTGPKDFKVQYSLDNSTWTDVANSTIAVATNWTSGVLNNVALPAETKNQDVVYVRWLNTSTTSIGGATTGTSGTNRMGFIEFKGTEVQTTTPAPTPDPNATPGKGTLTLGTAPLANIQFSLFNTATNVWFDFTSDANGVFTHNLADGTYKIEGIWAAPTWYVLGKTFTIKDGLVNGLTELTFDALDYEIPADTTANVKGSVKNGTAALSFLTFSIHNTAGEWFNAKTDKNGKFTFELPNGSYQVDGIWLPAQNKWYELNQTFTVTNGQLDGATELLIDIATVLQDNVTGTITKGATPLSNLTFSVRNADGSKWYSTTTNANGQYVLTLPKGTYTIEGIWDAVGYKWYVLGMEFSVDTTKQLNINVLTDGPVDLTPNVTGTIKKGTAAVANTTFSVRTTTTDVKWYDITTDANGTFSTQLPNGTYMLEGVWLGAESKWYSLQREFTVNGTYVLDIVLADAPKDFSLAIMHTNDSHANLDNVAKKTAAISKYRAANPDALLLDAGDVLTGTLYFNEYKGQADLEFMNLVGYDAMTFGNHEFDMGTGVLADFVKNAKFPFVSANVSFANDTNLQSVYNNATTANPVDGQIYNGIVKEINGEQVGIFGLTTAETPTISSPGAGVEFKDYIAEAQKSVNFFKAIGVNKIIAVTHIGYNDSLVWDNDLELAKQVEGIDVIVGGHTHVQLNAPVFETTGDEPTVIVQANEYNKFLGTLNVKFDAAGKVIIPETTGALVDISKVTDAEVAADPLAAQALQILNTKYKPTIDQKRAEVVGTAAVQLVGGNPAARVGETNLGNFITDGMLAKAKTINPNTVIALQNGGGVRVTLPAGNITLANVFQVLPFGNTLAIMDLKGSEIKAALEHGVSSAPATANGAFLQVSGLKFTYDSTKPVGSKVQTILVKGTDGTFTALDLTKNYFVATNIFTAKGGDGFSMLKVAYDQGRVSEPGFVDWEMFLDHINSQPNKVVNPQVEGRIVHVPTIQVAGADFSGTEASPKVYNGNVVVDVTGVTKIEHAIVKGNLTIKGGTGVQIVNVEVEGETIFE
jgi:2',3'-cyclic-nucleotide 2'-phosphodiesterase (5'-nucleotidase family)